MSNLEKAVMLGVGTIIFGAWFQHTTRKFGRSHDKVLFSKYNLNWRDEIADRIPIHKLQPSVN